MRSRAAPSVLSAVGLPKAEALAREGRKRRVCGQSRGKLDGFDLGGDEGFAVGEAEGFEAVLAEDGGQPQQLRTQVVGRPRARVNLLGLILAEKVYTSFRRMKNRGNALYAPVFGSFRSLPNFRFQLQPVVT